MRRIIRRTVRWTLYCFGAAVLGVFLVLVAFSWQASRREVQTAAVSAPPTGRFVKAADVDVFIQEAGPANGSVVLLIHGTGAWSEAWRESMTALANAGFHAVAVDLPPFGYSQRPGNHRYGKQDQATRIIGVLDALNISRVTLVGHSFGGGPTMEAAFLAPDRVKALVLVDAALGIKAAGQEEQPPSEILRAFLAARPLRDAVVATFLTNPLFTKRLLGLFIADPAHATPARVSVYQRPLAVSGSTQAIGEWLPELLAPPGNPASTNPASYQALRIPVFVVWGEDDTITPLSQGQHLTSITPGAELVVMKQVGHIPQIEDAPGFNDLLVKLLARLPPDLSQPPMAASISQ